MRPTFRVRAGAGAQTMAVGRVFTMRRRSASAKPLVSVVDIAPVPRTSQASSAAYSMAVAVGMSASTRGSRRGGFFSSGIGVMG